MHRISVTFLIAVALAAVALVAPSVSSGGLSGSAHGGEVLIGNGTFSLNGSWGSNDLFGPVGKYSGTIKRGAHLDCLEVVYSPPCAAEYTNCYEVTGELIFWGYYPISGYPIYTVTYQIGTDPLSAGAGVCRPPLPGNPRYIHYKGARPITHPATPNCARGWAGGTQKAPTWTTEGGPAWIDDFNFIFSWDYPTEQSWYYC